MILLNKQGSRENCASLTVSTQFFPPVHHWIKTLRTSWTELCKVIMTYRHNHCSCAMTIVIALVYACLQLISAYMHVSLLNFDIKLLHRMPTTWSHNCSWSLPNCSFICCPSVICVLDWSSSCTSLDYNSYDPTGTIASYSCQWNFECIV